MEKFINGQIHPRVGQPFQPVDRAAAPGVFSGMGDRKMVITANMLTRTHVVPLEVSLPLVPQLLAEHPQKYSLPRAVEPPPPPPRRLWALQLTGNVISI